MRVYVTWEWRSALVMAIPSGVEWKCQVLTQWRFTERQQSGGSSVKNELCVRMKHDTEWNLILSTVCRVRRAVAEGHRVPLGVWSIITALRCSNMSSDPALLTFFSVFVTSLKLSYESHIWILFGLFEADSCPITLLFILMHTFWSNMLWFPW